MIYQSSRIRQALAEGVMTVPLGFAHYSYANVCRKFADMFGKFDIGIVDLHMPEIYANADSAPQASCGRPPHVHLSFKPFDEIRLLKGAVNIGWLAWEFDQLPSFARSSVDSARNWNILNDYKHLLPKLDEIWVGCSYTRDVFRREGITNVEVMPAPIAMPEWRDRAATGGIASFESDEPCLAKADGDWASIARLTGSDATSDQTISSRVRRAHRLGGRVFLAVFNPGDMRKNAPALLAGFQRHIHRSKANDILIVKLVVDGVRRTLRTALEEDLPFRFREADLDFRLIDMPNITYVVGTLSDTEMRWLFRIADFYLCASSAEGQNLPLLEAISLGLVPVSTAGTAMADYITCDNACVIDTRLRRMDHTTASAYGLANVSWSQADFRDVAAALDKSLHLTADELASMRLRGWRLVRDSFGQDVILDRLLSRLAAHGCNVR